MHLDLHGLYSPESLYRHACEMVKPGARYPSLAAARLGLSRQGLLKLLVRLGLERRPTARTSDG